MNQRLEKLRVGTDSAQCQAWDVVFSGATRDVLATRRVPVDVIEIPSMGPERSRKSPREWPISIESIVFFSCSFYSFFGDSLLDDYSH